MAYSEVTERLQQSHDRLEATVRSLREELSEKNRMLERRNRLAALGEMAAGMAHEIRNPLGGIRLYASLLAGDLADRPASMQIVQKIASGVQRLEALVSQVLSFTREMRPTIVEADLRRTIDEALEMAAAATSSRQVRVRVDGPSPMPVRIDPLLMGQAVLNLVLNAAEAVKPGGLIEIQYGPPRDGMEETRFFLVVADDGPGIPAEVIDRVFNPFFTTRDTGTGLGLAIVHRVVEAHDGAIAASNRETGGARFEIRV